MVWEYIAKYLLVGYFFLWFAVIFMGKLPNVVYGAISLGMTLLIAVVIKNLTRRPRPYIKHAIKASVDDPPTDWSFPSGHTATAMSLAVSLYFASHILGTIGFILAIVLGISRIIVKVHSVADVVLGGLLGIVVSIVLNKLLIS